MRRRLSVSSMSMGELRKVESLPVNSSSGRERSPAFRSKAQAEPYR